MIGIITVSLFSYEVIKVISKSTEFWNAFLIIPLLCLSVFFVNMRETTSYGLLINKKTGIVGVNVVISTIINILLNILLIPQWDIMGAALATLLTQFIYWYLNYYFSQKEYFIPYESRKIVILFFSGALFSFVGLLINDLPLVLRLLIKSGCILSYPFVLFFLNFYEDSEIQAIRGFFRKWSNPARFTSNLKSLRNIKNDFDWQ
jgi:O-antigen/teichoic acid export membrane protein